MSNSSIENRWLDLDEPRPSPCSSCQHKHSGKATCDAFPTRIPLVFLTGENQHDEPYPGDNGIQYEEIK